MKIAAAGILVVVCLTVVALAQSVPLFMRGELQLAKNDADVEVGGKIKRCGEYFMLVAPSTPRARISYKYKTTVNGEESEFFGYFLQRKFLTVLDGKTPPRVEYTFTDSGDVTTITIKIAPKDYENAKDCIPQPKKKG